MSSHNINTSSGSDSAEQTGIVDKPDPGPTRLRSLHRLYIRRPLQSAKFRQDHRSRLPYVISRFIGYRPPKTEPPYDPLPFPPFTWLTRIPVRLEVWIFAWVGAFGGILLIEAIMSANTAFRDVYTAPIIVTSFGASAVLLFGVIESPLAQPRNFVLGHFVSALAGVCITRLFARNSHYQLELDNTAFHASPFVNGGLSMATSLLAQLVIGAVHPPAGATGLNAAVEDVVTRMSWSYLPVVLASSLIMLGWACVINNLGRRRYPIYWWSPSSNWTQGRDDNEEEENLKTLEEGKMRQYEDGGRDPEGLLEERLEGEGGDMATLERAESRDGIVRPMAVASGQEEGNMTEADEKRAQGN